MPRPSTDADLLSTVLERGLSIAARIGDTTASGCWPWTGAFTRNGYGTFSVSVISPDGTRSTRSLRAHRAVFMLHHERTIASDLTLHHQCTTTWCVNPAHLVEMTLAENNAVGAYGGASIRLRPTKAGVPRWAVLFREDGRQRSRAFGSLEEAETYAAARRAGTAA